MKKFHCLAVFAALFVIGFLALSNQAQAQEIANNHPKHSYKTLLENCIQKAKKSLHEENAYVTIRGKRELDPVRLASAKETCKEQAINQLRVEQDEKFKIPPEQKLREDFLRTINEKRLMHKKQALYYNPKLNEMAKKWAEFHKQKGLVMAYEHEGNTLYSRAHKAGYKWVYIKECFIRLEQDPDGYGLVRAWEQTTYNAIMLGPAKEVGLACVYSPVKMPPTTHICVAVFGSPK